MAFMNKEELRNFANLYGIDLEGKTWPEQQKIVQAELREHGFAVAKDGTVYDPNDNTEEALEDMEPEAEEEGEENSETEFEKGMTQELEEHKAVEALRDVLDQEIELAPYIPFTKTQLLKYDEDLGECSEVEEVYYDVAERIHSGSSRDLDSSTYRIKGTKRKVVAQSSLPKTNAGVKYRPSKDLVPVAFDNKHEGYIWCNNSYPNIKGLMLASGYYEEFKDFFDSKKNPQNIFYVAGKMLAVSKPVTEHVFRLIEQRAQQDKERRGY